jgi:hypothetical protein
VRTCYSNGYKHHQQQHNLTDHHPDTFHNDHYDVCDANQFPDINDDHRIKKFVDRHSFG